MAVTMLCVISLLCSLSIALAGRVDQQLSENVEISEFASFKNSVLNELRVLKLENEKKTKEINQLKNEVKNLREEHSDCSTESPRRRGISGPPAAFTAYLDHSVHNILQDQTIVYNKVLLNDGGYYNASTGIFMVPFTGVYLFSYSVGAKMLPGVHLNQYDVFTRLMVESDYQLSAVAESTGSYDDEQGSVTAILMVEEGARVWTKHEFKGGNNLFAEPAERVTSFTGTLLYQSEPAGIQGIIG